METEKLYAWAKALCEYSDKNEAFLEEFWQRLLKNKEILDEFSYYYEHQNFLCKAKIEGKSIVDIMIWQMDHFRAYMDRGSDMRCNKDKMLLEAFCTMLLMAENPQPYITKMEGETGTDFMI